MTSSALRLSLAGLLGLAGCTDAQLASDPAPDAGGPIEATPYSLHPDTADGTVHWPDAVVHFAIDPAFSANAHLMSALAAAQAFYSSVSSLTFQQDQSLLQNFSKPGIVYSVSAQSNTLTCPGGITTLRRTGTGTEEGNGAWSGSNIAMCGGSVALGTEASGRGTIIHETGHALGMVHEQKRSDRNQTVRCIPETMNATHPDMCGTEGAPNAALTVDWATCVAHPCSFAPQFSPLTDPAIVYGDYDKDSTMEYPSSFFSKIGAPTLTWKDPANPTATCTLAGTSESGTCMTQTSTLSIGDITMLRQLWQEPLQAVSSTAQFGAAVAVGDFDGDGFDDVAVGAPGTVWQGKTTGAVFVYKGTPGRRTLDGGTMGPTDWTTNLVPWRVLRPSDFGNAAQSNEQFGAALKAGDLSGHKRLDPTDHALDLAIGAPGRDGGTGAVYVGYGHVYAAKTDHGMWGNAEATLGLQTAGTTALPVYYPESAFYATTSKLDGFGASLAAANFDSDDMNELAIGAPGASRVTLTKHAGTARSLAFSTSVASTQTAFVVDFGRSLATIDLDGDGIADLVVGAPASEITTVNEGMIYVFTSKNLFHQTDATSAPGAAGGDFFGGAVAAGHYFASGAQIAVGAVGRASNTGRVFVYGWSANQLTGPQTIGESIDSHQQGASGDRFGAALRTAKLVGGNQDELVVGAPGKTGGAGAVFVLTSEPAVNPNAFTTGSMHTPPTGVPGTGFGGALSTGDLDGDGNLDLIAGAVGEAPFGSPGGNIVALHGSVDGVTGQKLWRFPAFKSEQK